MINNNQIKLINSVLLRLAPEKIGVFGSRIQPVFKAASYYGNTIAETLFENGLCFPGGSNLSKKDHIRKLLSS
jgi:hypothetical protein